jgi:hypothetical protein
MLSVAVCKSELIRCEICTEYDGRDWIIFFSSSLPFLQVVVIFLWNVKYNVGAVIFMTPAYNTDLQECDFIKSCFYHLHKL